MRLCVFQGTFNPIHNAHLKMANFVLKNFGFDKIIFIPAFNPPHKDFCAISPAERIKMVELGVNDNPCFEVSDIEYQRKGISYTYLTICELYEKYDITDKIYFIIGTDAFYNIESWYESDKLKDLVNFIVFARSNGIDKKRLDELKSKGYNFELAEMDFVDISSTQIRQKIADGDDISGILPVETERYIYEHGLYKNQ